MLKHQSLRTLRAALIGLVAFLSLYVIWRASPRLLSLPFYFSMCILGCLWAFNGRWKPVALAWTLFVGTTFIPVDIRPSHWIGRPKVLPVLMGLPSPRAKEAVDRGEVWLGGCVVHWNDPRWVIIW